MALFICIEYEEDWCRCDRSCNEQYRQRSITSVQKLLKSDDKGHCNHPGLARWCYTGTRRPWWRSCERVHLGRLGHALRWWSGRQGHSRNDLWCVRYAFRAQDLRNPRLILAVSRFYNATTGYAGSFFFTGPPFNPGIYKSQINFKLPLSLTNIQPAELIWHPSLALMQPQQLSGSERQQN